MSINDREVPETLDLIAKLVASVSARVDDQSKALAELAKAQEEAQARTDPDRIAALAARTIHNSLIPELGKIVDAMQELNGTKALLRARWRVVDREEARLGRWLFLPLTVTVGVPLALASVLALVMPSAVSQTPFTCRASSGEWVAATERYSAACIFPLE